MFAMNRRQLLKLVPPTVAASLAGCSGSENDESTQDDDTETDQPTQDGDDTTTRDIGDSITYAGLEISATDYVTIEEFTDANSDDEEDDPYMPRAGGVFVFVRISVTNVGENEMSFPGRGREIELIYNDQEASNIFTGRDMRANGTVYPNYSRVLEQKGADAGAFPDTSAQGWTIFELPEGFEPSDTIITVRVGSIDIDNRIFRWQLE